jgi:hypothetical protein
MIDSQNFRKRAAECAELVRGANTPGVAREFQTLERSFTDLADNEDWLEDNIGKTVHPNDKIGEPDRPAIAEDEGHILRNLGAAVIMRWNTIPTKLQKELFDDASSVGDLLNTSELKGRIARFLHEHKDDETGRAG